MATPNTHFGAERIGKMLQDSRHIFFIGIGGINMSSLAEITHRRGYRVSGSDRTKSALTEHLESCGIKVFYIHEASNIETCDAVVYTVAIPNDNPEYKKAKERGIPLISRADYMGYLMMAYPRRIGISGMHGKSTTTSMCAQLLMHGGCDPTVLSGASMRSMGGAYRLGQSENFVFEACEYMDSFLDFSPNVAVLLNVELDHVDYFKDIKQVRESYRRFGEKVLPGGVCIVNRDDENIVALTEGFAGRMIGFSAKNPKADYYAANVVFTHGRPDFDIYERGEWLCHAALSVPGEHNVMNALATAAVGRLCGLDGGVIASGLAEFAGAERRMEYKGKFSGADVYDDYGHHPTEVKTTLQGAARMDYDRIFCVFQSHTYSRTAGLFEEFKGAFGAVDEAIIADIYAAREADTGIVSAKKLAEALPNGRYVGDMDAIVSYLQATLCEGDLLVVMGAGDIYRIFGKMGL